MPSSPASASYRVCRTCFCAFSLDQFPRRYRGNDDHRKNQCRLCGNAKMRAYRRKKSGQRFDRFAQQLASAAQSKRLGLLVDQMVQRFGGIERLTAAWWGHLTAAKPGSRAAALGMAALVHLASAASQASAQPRNLDHLSSAELRERLALLVGQLQNP